MKRGMNRRRFLKAAAAAIAAPLVIPGSAIGANGATPPSERLTFGLIGRGAMGGGHLRRIAGDPTVQLLAVCEVDSERREHAKRTVDEVYGRPGCAAYNDYREMIARPDIDGIIVVTPDHWHALQSIDAAKAGKDIYCEKPVSVTIDEGRQIVNAVERYGRIFQTGTQYRSIPTIRRICQFVREGGLGKVRAAFTILDPLWGFIRSERLAPYAARMNLEVTSRHYYPVPFDLPAEPVPPGLDWNLWVGPAPWRPYCRAYHINPSPGVVPWSFDEAFGVAATTWHLSHSTDVIQYALGVERTGPVRIIHPSSGEFPTLTCRYANGTLLHLVDHWGVVRDVYKAVPPTARLTGLFGGVFVGERGWLTSMSAGGPVDGAPESLFREMSMPSREVVIGANDHHADFFHCMRTRQRTRTDAEIGHRSACIGHLAMIACRLGRSLDWDPVNEVFTNDEAANRLRARALREPWNM